MALLQIEALKNGDEDDQSTNPELASNEVDDPNRGRTRWEHIKRQNFAFCYGCGPGKGVLAKTNMMNEIAEIFRTEYSRVDFTLIAPDCFDGM